MVEVEMMSGPQVPKVLPEGREQLPSISCKAPPNPPPHTYLEVPLCCFPDQGPLAEQSSRPSKLALHISVRELPTTESGTKGQVSNPYKKP